MHIWLPKAHVEASTVGSMVLAALLLKLGGYGVYIILVSCSIPVTWLYPVVILGVACSVMVVLSIGDMKAVVAYASVSHMCLVVGRLLCATSVGPSIALYIMFFHALVSALLFYLVGSASYAYESRLCVWVGMGGAFVCLTLMLLGVVLNIGVPPTVGFWCEWLFLVMLVEVSTV